MQPAVQAELAQMTREELIERCQALHGRVSAQGKTLPGQPQYFLTPEGYLLWQERTVRLMLEGCGLTNVPGGVGTIIDALGWDRINEVLRVHVYLNPNATMLPAGAPPRSVRVSGAAVGCIGGVPQVHTLSLTWAFYDMFLAELINKVKYNKAAGAMGVRDQRPAGFDRQPLNFYEIEGGAGVWANLQHEDIITCLKTLQDRRSKPDRAAYTFLKRNLIRSFAGGISQKVAGSPADIVVRGWYYPLDKDRLERIALGAMRGEQADGEVQLQVVPDEQVQSAEEGAAADAELVDETTGEPVARAGTVPLAVEPGPPAVPAQAQAAPPAAQQQAAPQPQPAMPPPAPASPGDIERELLLDTVRLLFSKLAREQKLELRKRFPAKADDMPLDMLQEVKTFIDTALATERQSFFNPAK